MELCNAGSLYEVIDSPENAYGLDEEQFKLVVLHVCELYTTVCLPFLLSPLPLLSPFLFPMLIILHSPPSPLSHLSSLPLSSARGLCHLKKKGFVHRDIKPGNILRVKDVDGRWAWRIVQLVAMVTCILGLFQVYV